MRAACDVTAEGFDAVIGALPEAVRRGRGERWVEGVFALHARHAGNAVGYDTIAASGDHANTLHWITNDGDIAHGDLLLLDAGVELNSLYTADITRTLPVSGTVHAHPAQGVRGGAGRAAGRHRGRRGRGRSSPTCTTPRSRVHRGAPARLGPAARSTPRSRSTPSAADTTDGGWCTARPTIWVSTCTTAPRPGAELSPGHPAARHGHHRRARPLFQVQRPASYPRNCAASGCGSRTTS